MPLSPEQFNRIKGLHISMANMNKKDATKLAKQIEAMLEDLVIDEGEDRTFSDFFKQVGQGMLETQQELDQRSEQYIQSVRDKPHLLPSVFRMPEVSGKLRVGLNQESKTKLNFIVFGKSSASTTWAEHEVNFKLVGVPPSPDALRTLDALPGSLSLVLGPGERALVFESIARCLDAGSKEGVFDPGPFASGLAQAALAFTKPGAAILIWRDGDGVLLLVTAFQQKNKPPSHGAWKLHPKGTTQEGKETKKDRLTPVWKVTKTQQREKEYVAVDGYLSRAYEEQRKLLEGLQD